MISLAPNTELENFWADEADEQLLGEKLGEIWRDLLPVVSAKLAHYDLNMKTKYQEKVALGDMGIQYIFFFFYKVLVKQRRVGKLLPRAVGPLVFVKYSGPLKLTALVEDPSTSQIRPFSSAHLILA